MNCFSFPHKNASVIGFWVSQSSCNPSLLLNSFMPQNCSNISLTCLNSTPNRAFGSCLTSSLHEWIYQIISLLFYFYILNKSTLYQMVVKSISRFSMDFTSYIQFCCKLHVCVQRNEFPAPGEWRRQCTLIRLQMTCKGKCRHPWDSWHPGLYVFMLKFWSWLTFLIQAIWTYC